VTSALKRRSEALRSASRLTSAVSMEHGTPPEGVEFARYVLGGRITTDPSSSAYWNHHSVKADVFYDVADNGLKMLWHGTVMVNAPGSDEESGTPTLVRPFWERGLEQWRAGVNDGLVWIGYSVQQLGMLQGSPGHPLQFPTVMPCERFKFLRKPRGGGPPVPGDQPMHFNYISLLPSRRDPDEARAQIGRFLERGRHLGAVVRPAL
jgi:hypothetical protein